MKRNSKECGLWYRKLQHTKRRAKLFGANQEAGAAESALSPGEETRLLAERNESQPDMEDSDSPADFVRIAISAMPFGFQSSSTVITRPLTPAEAWSLYHFERHARECSTCHDPLGVH